MHPAFSRQRILVIGSAALLTLTLLTAAQSGNIVFGTKTSAIYHTRECGSGKQIAADRRVTFASEDEAIKAGRRKCKQCVKIDGRAAPSGNDAGPSSKPAPRPDVKRRRTATRPAAAASMPATVRVSEVLDGDTLKLESGERIRLMGVGCPEVEQRIGTAARRFVEERVFGRTVEITADPMTAHRGHRDQWGRWLAYVRMPKDGRDLSEAIIAEGLGWCDQDNACSRKDQLLALEKAARDAKKGLWKPLPDPQGRQTVYVSLAGLSYHLVECPHLKRVKVPRVMTLNEAVTAGYRPCSHVGGI